MAIDRSVRGQILRELRTALKQNPGTSTIELLANLTEHYVEAPRDEDLLATLRQANVRFYMVRNKVTGKFATKSWSDGQPIAGKLYRRLADAQQLANRKNHRWNSSTNTTDWEVVATNAPIQFVPVS